MVYTVLHHGKDATHPHVHFLTVLNLDGACLQTLSPGTPPQRPPSFTSSSCFTRIEHSRAKTTQVNKTKPCLNKSQRQGKTGNEWKGFFHESLEIRIFKDKLKSCFHWVVQNRMELKQFIVFIRNCLVWVLNSSKSLLQIRFIYNYEWMKWWKYNLCGACVMLAFQTVLHWGHVSQV